MSERVSALFATRENAERAAAALMDHGVDREEIAMVARGPVKVVGEDPGEAGAVTVTSPGDIAVGAATGAGVGAVVGLLATMAFVLPGVGPIVAAGPLAAALATGTGLSAAAGAVVGGVYGALHDLGIEDAAARRYESGIFGGLTLLSVRTAAMATTEIEAIFAKYGATDITAGLLPDPDPDTPGIVDEAELARIPGAAAPAAGRAAEVVRTPGEIDPLRASEAARAAEAADARARLDAEADRDEKRSPRR